MQKPSLPRNNLLLRHRLLLKFDRHIVLNILQQLTIAKLETRSQNGMSMTNRFQTCLQSSNINHTDHVSAMGHMIGFTIRA